jgi:hypothetical protein
MSDGGGGGEDDTEEDIFGDWGEPMGNDPEALADIIAETIAETWGDTWGDPQDSISDTWGDTWGDTGDAMDLGGFADPTDPQGDWGSIDWDSLADLINDPVHDPFGNYDPNKDQDRPGFNHLGHPPQQTINEFITQPAVAMPPLNMASPFGFPNAFVGSIATNPNAAAPDWPGADFGGRFGAIADTTFAPGQNPDWGAPAQSTHAPTNPNSNQVNQVALNPEQPTQTIHNVALENPMPQADPRGGPTQVAQGPNVDVVGWNDFNSIDAQAPPAASQVASNTNTGLPGGMTPASGVGVPGFAPHGGVSDPDRDPSNPGASIAGGPIGHSDAGGLIDPRVSYMVGLRGHDDDGALRGSFTNYLARTNPADRDWVGRTRMDANGQVGLVGMGREGDTGIGNTLFEPTHTRDPQGNPVAHQAQWDDRMAQFGFRNPNPTQQQTDDNTQRSAMIRALLGLG